MFPFTKRQFLKVAGLAIAGRIMPRRLWGAPRRNDAARKLIVVTFGGGVRYAETFAPEGLRNIPRLAELQPKGRFFRNCVNSGVLSHYNSTSSILTGNWQRVDDFGLERPASPTMFEYFRRGGAPSTDAWAICTNKSFGLIGASSHRDFGVPAGANVILPKQLLLEAVEQIVRKNPRQGGVADRQNVLDQLQEILNEGYEGVGWTIFQGNRELDKTIRETLTRSLVEYIQGPEAPSSGDELTFFIAREVMREFAPRLLLVNFWDMDVAHWGSYSLYLGAVNRTDRLTGMLWDEAGANPAYKDRTSMIVLPELGRDGDVNTANGFLNHRSGDPACRNMWLLALGAGVTPGVTERPIAHVDVARTGAEILGFKAGEMGGQTIRELAG